MKRGERQHDRADEAADRHAGCGVEELLQEGHLAALGRGLACLEGDNMTVPESEAFDVEIFPSMQGH